MLEAAGALAPWPDPSAFEYGWGAIEEKVVEPAPLLDGRTRPLALVIPIETEAIPELPEPDDAPKVGTAQLTMPTAKAAAAPINLPLVAILPLGRR